MKDRIDTKYFIPEDLNGDSVVVSGGGFLGEWDWYIHKTYECFLYSFEPFPENYSELVKLFPPKFCNRVVVIMAALWDTDAHAILHLVNGKGNGHSLYNRSEAGKKVFDKLKVKTMRLDTFMRKYKVPQIDLLKLNVEGAEVQILNSLDKETAKKIKHICFSTHERSIITEEDKDRTMNHLEKIGYKVEPYTDPKWDFDNRWRCSR